MQSSKSQWILGLALGIIVLAAGAPRVHAVGTAAGTSVANRASVSFTGGSGPQVVESSPTGNSTPGATNGTDTAFLVDQMVDLTVAEADATYTLVMAGDLQVAVGFNVSNTGNETQDILLSAENLPNGNGDPFGGTDNFEAGLGSVAYYVDDGDGVFEPGADDGAPLVGNGLDAVIADQVVFVWVAADIPGVQLPGDIAGLVLVAEARINDGAAGPGGALTEDTDGDDPALQEILFADGSSGDTASDVDSDARFSDTDAYFVEAELTVTKTSLIFTDPVRCSDQENPATCTDPPLAIPGAYLEYTITIDNQSATPANTVVISDSLAAMIAAGNVVFRSGAYVTGTHGIRFQINGGGYTDVTDAVDGDPGDFGGTPDTVTLSLPAPLASGDVAEVQFQVVLQ